jgi:hypothetical protein
LLLLLMLMLVVVLLLLLPPLSSTPQPCLQAAKAYPGWSRWRDA